MDISLATVSSKGQIVIPSKMRKGIKAGDRLMMIRDKDKIVLKRIDDLEDNFKEDLEFARRTEKVLELIKGGDYSKMKFDDFVDEMKRW